MTCHDGLGDEIELAKKSAWLHVAIDALQSLPSTTLLDLGGGADAGRSVFAGAAVPAAMRRDAQMVQLQGGGRLLVELLELDKADGKKKRRRWSDRLQRAKKLADPTMARPEIAEFVESNGVFKTVGLCPARSGGDAVGPRTHGDGHAAGGQRATLSADHVHITTEQTEHFAGAQMTSLLHDQGSSGVKPTSAFVSLKPKCDGARRYPRGWATFLPGSPRFPAC